MVAGNGLGEHITDDEPAACTKTSQRSQSVPLQWPTELFRVGHRAGSRAAKGHTKAARFGLDHAVSGHLPQALGRTAGEGLELVVAMGLRWGILLDGGQRHGQAGGMDPVVFCAGPPCVQSVVEPNLAGEPPRGGKLGCAQHIGGGQRRMTFKESSLILLCASDQIQQNERPELKPYILSRLDQGFALEDTQALRPPSSAIIDGPFDCVKLT